MIALLTIIPLIIIGWQYHASKLYADRVRFLLAVRGSILIQLAGKIRPRSRARWNPSFALRG